jgi:hypothetical protein
MPVLDHRLKDILHHFRDSGRLSLLIALISHANVRNRCWPSMRLLAKETGYGLAAINEAKKWLEETGAIEVVKYDERVGDEKKKINHLQNVYQLTGVIKLNGKVHPYLYVSVGETSASETSLSETSASETEVVKVVKVVPDKKKEKEKKETTIPAVAVSGVSSSVINGKSEKSAQAEKGSKRLSKPTTTPTTPQPPAAPAPVAVDDVERFSAKLDEVKGEKINPAVALGEAWGIAPANGDFSLYMRKAKELLKDIPIEEFKAYCDWRKKQAGDFASKLSIATLTGNGHVSAYLAQRNEAAEKARKQKEAEERLYAQNPHLIPPDAPVEYASPDEVRALILAAMKPATNTREEAS